VQKNSENDAPTFKEILKEFSVVEILGMTVAFLLGCALIVALTALAYFLLHQPNTI